MRFFQGRYILYIYLFVFLQSAWAQEKQHLSLEKNISNDSLQKLIQKQNWLQTVLYRLDKTDSLTGVKVRDSLQVFINRQKYKIYYRELDSFLLSVNDSWVRKGQIFNRLKPQKIRLQNNRLEIYYSIENTQDYAIDSIVYNRADFPQNIRRLLYRKYKAKKISATNLNQIGSFIQRHTRFVLQQPPSILFSGNKTLVQINTTKALSNSIEGFLGLAYAPDNEKLQLQGSLHTILYNVFKVNESLKLKWQRNQDKQLLDWQVEFPFFKATDFSLENSLTTGRQDTLQAFVYDKLQLKYTYKNHQWMAGYVFDRKTDMSTQNYLSAGYKFIFQKSNLTQFVQLDWQYDWQTENYLGFLQLDLNRKIFKKLFLHNAINLMYNTTGNKLSQTTQTTLFYRRFEHIQVASNWISSIKNEMIWKKNELNLYLIVDLIKDGNLENQIKTRVNTGLGLQIHKKNQILTFELIKPFDDMYVFDNQQVYINIKQQFKF